jgi:hypothetical protein
MIAKLMVALMAVSLIVAAIGTALLLRNVPSLKGFPVATGLTYENYFDDNCTVKAVHENRHVVPWRYAVQLQSSPSSSFYVAVDYSAYKAHFDDNSLTETTLRSRFPKPSHSVNDTVPCMYTVTCAKTKEWTLDSEVLSSGVPTNLSKVSLFDIYRCKILTGATSSQLPRTSFDTAIVGCALLGIAAVAFLVFLCVFLCCSSCCC